MTSGDTNAKTVALLKEHANFGMDDDQITIVQQGQGVPALSDNNAAIALDPSDPCKVLAKPHGHGDVHARRVIFDLLLLLLGVAAHRACFGARRPQPCAMLACLTAFFVVGNG